MLLQTKRPGEAYASTFPIRKALFTTRDLDDEATSYAVDMHSQLPNLTLAP